MKTAKKKDEPQFLDIRVLLKPGFNGEAVIDDAMELEERGNGMGLPGRVWILRFTHEGDHYVASECVVQTEGWVPEEGDRVRFERQPSGVEDTILYVTLLP